MPSLESRILALEALPPPLRPAGDLESETRRLLAELPSEDHRAELLRRIDACTAGLDELSLLKGFSVATLRLVVRIAADT